MTASTPSKTYQALLAWAERFHQANSPEPIDGEIYEQAGSTVYNGAKLPLETGGRIEINIITPEAVGFSWRVEFTIDDAANTLYQHILLQTDNTIVETYGKTVIPVSEDEAEVILGRLQRLATEI